MGFKRELVKEVAVFVTDVRSFRAEWEAKGPMVPGLDPMEAVDRLKKFQQMFEVGQPLTPCLLWSRQPFCRSRYQSEIG